MPDKEIAKKKIDFETILRTAMDLPGVRINREDFLKKTLSKHFDDDIVNKAISSNPAQAGINIESLERLAKSSINFETSKVAGLSAAAGVPGFKAMPITVPADMAQFFAHILRILQKLAYLYGWQEMLKGDEDDELDDGTSNQLYLFVGVMFGVNAANAAILKIANLAAQGVPKHLMKQALTHGAIYPIIKKTLAVIGVKMTKPIFTQAVGKAIPIVGAIVSGGVTFALFKPMSNRLKKYLATLPTASVDFYKESHENDIIDVDFADIAVDDVDDVDDNDDLLDTY
jgi:hypothetical protein